MTRLAEAIQVTHTEATLEARGVFRVARRLASSVQGPVGEALACELDELVDTYTDALQMRDGLVSAEEYERVIEAEKDARADEEKADKEKDEAEERLEELLDAAKETPEEVLSKLTEAVARQEKHDAELARMTERVRFADERVRHAGKMEDKYREETASMRAERDAALARMASWCEDRTAAETADIYRAKYEAERGAHERFIKDVAYTLDESRKNARTSKVKRELIQSIEIGINNRARKP